MEALNRCLGLVFISPDGLYDSDVSFTEARFLDCMAVEEVVERMLHLNQTVQLNEEMNDLAYTLSELLGERFISVIPNNRAFNPILWQDDQHSACRFSPAGEVVYDHATNFGMVYEGHEVVDVEDVGDSLTLVQVVGDRRVVYHHGDYGAAPPCDVDEDTWSRIKPKWDAMMTRFAHPYEFLDLTG